jgi:hypothetical protein
MRVGSSAFVLCLALGVSIAGCGQKNAQQKPAAKAPAAAPAPPISDDEAAADKEKRPRFGDAAVYVDGKNMGTLRLPELPSSLKGNIYDLGSGYKVTRYPFTQYARSLGVDPAKVRALHLYGGKRVAVFEGDEYRRVGDHLVFSFTGGERGKPRVHFPPMKTKVNTTIDMLTSVVFYVDKEPPHLENRELVMPDGSPVGDKVPYAPEEQDKGTRVYVDGKLAGFVKRKKVTNDMVVPVHEEGPTRFSLLSYAAKLNPSAESAKNVELVAGDDVVASLTPDNAKKVTFHVPRRNRGQAVVDLQTQSGEKLARISAVLIHVNSAAPARSIVPFDDAPEAQPKVPDAAGSEEL